jgi:hypothetical protein
MRPRRWILVLALVPALSILGFLAAWHLLDLDEHLRRDLLARLEARGLEDVALRELHPAWVGLDLRGLAFTLPGGGLRLESRSARLRLGPLSWLKSPARLLAALEWVEVADFSLRADSLLLARREAAPGQADWLPWLKQHASTLAQLPEIRLRGGRILWQGSAGDDLVLVEDLEGLVIRRGQVQELLLRSRLLGNRHQAFHAGMELDPAALDGSFHLTLDSLRQSTRPSAWLPGVEEFTWRGSLDMGGRLRAGSLDSLAGHGDLVLEEMRLAAGGTLRGACALQVGADSLRLKDGRLVWQEQDFEFQAALPWRLEGSAGWLRAAGLDLGRMGAGAGITAAGAWPALDGQLDLLARGRWQKEPRVELALRARGLGLAGKALGEAELDGSWVPGRLVLDRLWWQHGPGLQARGRAVLAGRGDALAVELGASLAVELDSLPRLRGLLADSVRADLRLDLRAERGGKGWRLSSGGTTGGLSRAGLLLLDVQGGLVAGQLMDGHLPEGELDLRRPGGGSLGRLQWLDGAARRWEAELAVQGGILGGLLGLRTFQLPEDLAGLIRLEGAGLQTEAHADLALRGRRAVLDGQLAWSDSLRTLEADLALEGWRGSRLEGRLRASLAGRRLDLLVFRLEGMDLSGWLDLDERRYMAELVADDLPLAPFWDLLMEDPAPADPGILSLLAAGEGSLDSLGFRGGLEWRQRLLDRHGRLWADLTVDRQVARLERGSLSLDGVEWASLDLFWSLGQGPRELLLQLLNRDLGELGAAGRPFWLRGRATGHLRVDFAAGRNRGLEGRLQVAEPRLGGLTFDELSLSLSRGTTPGRISLDSLVLARGGAAPLRLDLRGDLPFGAGELDLDLSIVGDLLHPLTVTSSGTPSRFFHHASGRGDLRLGLGGGLLEPQIRDGRLELRRGSLGMASVFRRVRDLEARLEIQGGRLVIERCDARVGDTRLRIGNTWEAVADGHALDSWALERPELDLGVLVLETLDPRGQPGAIELNLPGLMEPDWSARVVLLGAAAGERFFVAGPMERPQVRGRAQVDHAEFTYPFIKGDEAPTPLLAATISLLNSIEWDLALQGGRNINYWRKLQGFDDTPVMDLVKGYLDRITLDLYLDPTIQPLRITGQIDDESFRLAGDITCSRGTVLFLDKDFEVEEAGLSFDASTLLPVVWGRAVHNVMRATDDPGLQSLFSQDARQVGLQFSAEDELGNRQLRGRWDEIRVELVGGQSQGQDVFTRGQEELLVEMGLNPYDPGASIESLLPDVVAGFWEIPLRPIESRIRRRLGLDEVRIFLPVLRNTVEELLSAQSTQERVSQSYLDYLQGTRVILGKTVSRRTFASWTGQLVASTPVEGRSLVRVFQRCNLNYEVSRNLSLTGELVFDPLREAGALRGDPRVLLHYRQRY